MTYGEAQRQTCKVLCDSGSYKSGATGSRWLLTHDRREDTGLGGAQGVHRLEHSAEKESESQEGWVTCLMSGGRQREGLGQAPGPRATLPLFYSVSSLHCVSATSSVSPLHAVLPPPTGLWVELTAPPCKPGGGTHFTLAFIHRCSVSLACRKICESRKPRHSSEGNSLTLQ